MKIGYVTSYDVLNGAKWTKNVQGICSAGFYIAKNLLDESTSIEYIGPLRKKYTFLTRAKWSLYRNLYKKDYYRWAEPLVVKNYAHQIKNALNNLDVDVILSSESTVPAAYLDVKKPIVLWTDTTLSGLINFYSYMSNLCRENIQNIYKIELEALNRFDLIIYTSEWAAKMASQTYGIPENKIKVVPWGANLESNRTPEDIHHIIQKKDTSKCKLLFIGVDWVRKGGDIALAVAKKLNAIGLETELNIVGCKPQTNQPLPDFVNNLGFISKSNPEGFKKIEKLLCESHFLILPSRAEAFGLVFCEANSFGVPSLASSVGGIPTIIKDGKNGKTFSLDAKIEEYCTYIYNLFTNYSSYKELAISSFHEYQSRLNWKVSAYKVKNLINNLTPSI